VTLDDVIAAVEGYVTGVAERDAARLGLLFADTAVITGDDEGRWISVPRDRWIAFVCAEDREGWGGRKGTIRRLSIEGGIACAVVETVYGSFRYLDTLLVGETPDGPKVLCKAFHQLPLGAAS
jgi:hypothetical protein